MTLLILGGTSDGRHIAAAAHKQGIDVIYSVAGLVRLPNLDCRVISGGFTQFGGLAAYIAQQNITAILDVTHPYAEQMSTKAALAATQCKIPYWRYHRAPWLPKNNQPWFEYKSNNYQTLVDELTVYSSVLLSIGQLEPAFIDLLRHCNKVESTKYIVRTAAAAKFTLLDNMTWRKAIGPFNLEDELALLKEHNIHAIVTKNSGGEATYAKLQAAEMLNIPVYIQSRPTLPPADKLFTDHVSCLTFLMEMVSSSQNKSHSITLNQTTIVNQ